MKKFTYTALILALTCGAMQAHAATNLVTNGSFEANVVAGASGYDTFSAGSTGLTGWKIEAVDNARRGFGEPVRRNGRVCG